MKTAILAVCCLAVVASAQWLDTIIPTSGCQYRYAAWNPHANVVYVVFGAAVPGRGMYTIDCSTDALVSLHAIPITAAGHSVVYDTVDRKVYLSLSTGGYGDTILVFDGMTHELIRSVPLPSANFLAWEPTRNRLYANSMWGDSMAVLDCTADTVMAYIRTPVLGRMILNPQHDKMYVLSMYQLDIVDLAQNRVVSSVYKGEGGANGCYCSQVDKFYCEGDDHVWVVDGGSDSVLKLVDLGEGAHSLCFACSPARPLVAVSVQQDKECGVRFLDAVGDTVLTSVLPGGGPIWRMVWSPVTELLYCTLQTANDVLALCGDGSGVGDTVSVGDMPQMLCLAPGSGRLYVGHGQRCYDIYVIRDALAGVAEKAVCKESSFLCPTVVRASLSLPWTLDPSAPWTLISITGRRVMDLKPGMNDIRHIAPGAYFVRSAESGERSAVTKVVIQR